jgi:hypothetical protein
MRRLLAAALVLACVLPLAACQSEQQCKQGAPAGAHGYWDYKCEGGK